MLCVKSFFFSLVHHGAPNGERKIIGG